MARDLILDVITKSDDRGLDNTAKGLDRVGESSNRTTRSFKAMADESGHVDREITRLRSTIADMHKEIDRTGGDKGMFGDLRKAKADLRQFEQIASEMAPKVGQSLLGGITSALSLGRGEMIAVLVGVAAAAAPVAGGMLAGGITAALGTGVIAAGIAAAAQDARVKSAASEVWHSIGAEFAADGDVLVGPVIRSLAILKQGFMDMHLEKIFAQVAPFIEMLAHGLAGFGTSMMPGISEALAGMAPIFKDLQHALPFIGAALGHMFSEIANSRGAVSGFRALLAAVNGTIRFVGISVAWLSDRFADLVETASPFAQAGAKWFGWVPLLGPAFKGAADNLGTLSEAQNNMSDVAGQGMAKMLGLGKTSDEIAASFRSTTMSVQGLKDALNALFDQQMSVDQATLRTKTDMLAFRASVEANGTSLSSFTQTGVANQNMLLGLITDYEATRDASIALHHNTAAATRKFDEQVASLIKLAGKLGFSKTEIDKLLGAYKKLHDAPDIKKEIEIHFTQTGAMNIANSVGAKAQFSFAEGGWVPGPPGAPVPAVVHGGEYVISRDQMAGRGVTGGGQGPGPFSAPTGRTVPISVPAGSLESVLFGWLRKYVQDNYGGDIVAAVA